MCTFNVSENLQKEVSSLEEEKVLINITKYMSGVFHLTLCRGLRCFLIPCVCVSYYEEFKIYQLPLYQQMTPRKGTST